MSSDPDQFGRIWKCTPDYGSEGKKLNLSKASMGLFLYSLMKCDGEIGSVYVMNRNYERSYSQASIKIHPNKIKDFEEMTGMKLEDIPQLRIN